MASGAADAQVALDFEDQAFPLVADQGRILQVLTNLVGNAIRHSPKQSTVHLRMLQRDSYARCEVTDEGPGIPADLRSRIFDRFFQVSSGIEQPTGGTGLGLAISRLIVAQHGGTIGVDGGPSGCGSTFWLEIPLALSSPFLSVLFCALFCSRLSRIVVFWLRFVFYLATRFVLRAQPV